MGGAGGAMGGSPGVMAKPVLHEIKIISCSRTRYKPNWTKRSVEVCASSLQEEYLRKARTADRLHGGAQEGGIGRVENKLISLGPVQGIVCGNFGEVSESTHHLVAAMATSRVRVAGPSRGKRGFIRGEDSERALVISNIRRKLGVATVRAQASSLLGRLEVLGTGSRAAAGRWKEMLELEY